MYSFSGRKGAKKMKFLRFVSKYSQDNVSCCQPLTFSVIVGCKSRIGPQNLGLWTVQDSKMPPCCLILSLWSETYFPGDDEHLQRLLSPVKAQTETIFDVSSLASKIVHIKVENPELIGTSPNIWPKGHNFYVFKILTNFSKYVMALVWIKFKNK